MKVLYLPGILGSRLEWQVGQDGPLHPVWLSLPAAVSGELATLQLGADGLGPGPLAEGRALVAGSPLPEVYAPLALWMGLLGWEVLPLGYDWRLSHVSIAGALWPVVRAWLGADQLYVLAHSQGGLVARALYGQMLAAGQGGQLARILTLGTPHFGSLEPVRMWWRLPTLYRGLVLLTAGALTWPAEAGPAYLDSVLASHPSWYELQAWAAAGPLWQAYPDQAASIYTAAFYAGGNPFVSADLFQSAEVVQADLAGLLPAGKVVSIAGTGHETVWALRPGGDPARADGWQTTQEGDGSVTVAQASPPGVPVLTVESTHDFLPLLPEAWALVASVLPAGV